MKNYIARFGHGSAKLARQAQSKEKTLAKMVAGGLTEKGSRFNIVAPTNSEIGRCHLSRQVDYFIKETGTININPTGTGLMSVSTVIQFV